MPSVTVTDELEAFVLVRALLERREREAEAGAQPAVESIDRLLEQVDATTAYRVLVDVDEKEAV